MRSLFIITLLAVGIGVIHSQNVGISTMGNNPHPSALLDLNAEDKGVLVPRMGTAQRESIANPAMGLLVFDTDTRSFWFHTTTWSELISSSNMGTAGGDLVGQYPAPLVAKLQGHPVSALTPAHNQIMKWDSAGQSWKGKNDSLFLPYFSEAAHPGALLSVANTFIGFVPSTAIRGQTVAPSGITLNSSAGVWGDADSGNGVLGTSHFHSGVQGRSNQSHGVEGNTSATNKSGVFGFSDALSSSGVMGEASGETSAGVKGIAHAPYSRGVFGTSDAPHHGIGVYGSHASSDAFGIGVYGTSNTSNVDAGGVVGYNSMPQGIGVNGRAPFGTGVNGFSQSHTGYGVRGINENGGTGIYGIATAYYYSGTSPIGVHGKAFTADSIGYGVLGVVVGSGDGVRGYGGYNGSGISGHDSENGTGGAGHFQIAGGSNSKDAVTIINNGMGRSLYVEGQNGSNTNPLVVFQKGGSGDYAVFRNGGGVKKIRFDSEGKGFFNGGVQTGGADIAEVFETDDEDSYEPGDVLIISTQTDRSVTKSSEPYSTLVAGVFATKPGMLMSEEEIDVDMAGKVPMGVVGVIPTKVCLEGGPIRRGDLLVTSSIPGTAMKGDAGKIQVGQVLGKALEEYSSNEAGMIRVLVNVR